MSHLGKNNNHFQAHNYQITVYGIVDQSWSDWFGGLTLTPIADEDGIMSTQLTGALPDQGALRGIVNKLWDLNFTVVSINCLDLSSRSTKNEK
jgi:hypothetical protein